MVHRAAGRDERVVVLHVAADNAAPLLHRPGAWVQRLAATRWIRQFVEINDDPELDLLEGPRGADATGARLDRFAGERWMAVGDAALSFDPLSSQGMLDALYTGVLAAEAIDAHLRGDPQPHTSYSARLEKIRTTYLRHHRQAYRSEHRWAEQDFWRCRHA